MSSELKKEFWGKQKPWVTGLFYQRFKSSRELLRIRMCSFDRVLMLSSEINMIGRCLRIRHFFPDPCVGGKWTQSISERLVANTIMTASMSAGYAVVKNPSANAGDLGDMGLVPGSGRSPGSENGNSLRYSCQENPMDRGVWWPII